jgi:hypothetical protein
VDDAAAGRDGVSLTTTTAAVPFPLINTHNVTSEGNSIIYANFTVHIIITAQRFLVPVIRLAL